MPLHSSITHQWATWYPLWCDSTTIRATQSLSALPGLNRRSSIAFHTPFPTFNAPHLGMGAPQFALAHLGLDCHSYIEFRTLYPPPLSALLWELQCASIPICLPQLRFGAPQSPLELLSLDLALFFILPSSITFCVLLFSTQHSPSWPSSFPGGCSPFSSE